MATNVEEIEQCRQMQRWAKEWMAEHPGEWGGEQCLVDWATEEILIQYPLT